MQTLAYIPHTTIKQIALEAVASLPDTASMDDIMYKLYVIEQIQTGLQASSTQELTTASDLQREIEQW